MNVNIMNMTEISGEDKGGGGRSPPETANRFLSSCQI